MNRLQLEHLIRAAAAMANVTDIVVIGSQSILGAYPVSSPELTVSIKADVFPKDAPQRSIVIDGAIGEGSIFHETFGYYAHGVDDTTAILPQGWQSRLIRISNPNTMGAVGWCLDPHDLAISKLIAGREKDLSFFKTMMRDGMLHADVLRERLASVSTQFEAQRQIAGTKLEACLTRSES